MYTRTSPAGHGGREAFQNVTDEKIEIFGAGDVGGDIFRACTSFLVTTVQ